MIQIPVLGDCPYILIPSVVLPLHIDSFCVGCPYIMNACWGASLVILFLFFVNFYGCFFVFV